MIEHVPLYPLAPLLFLIAVVLFTLLMARHLRVFAYARGAANVGDEPGRLGSLFKYAIVQVRMFRDLDAGLLHAAIFWGFVILTVGTFDRVSFGLVETIVRPLLGGWLWRLLVLGQNIFIVTVIAVLSFPAKTAATIDSANRWARSLSLDTGASRRQSLRRHL